MRLGEIKTDIIENGLVINIDAGNRSCYPGSGTITTDTVSNESGTLSGNTSFQKSSNNIGEFYFDGVDDYILYGNIPECNYADQQPFSINAWFKLNNGTPLTTSSHLYTILRKYSSNNAPGYAFFLRGSSSNNGLVFRSTGTGGLKDTIPDSDVSSTLTDYNYHNVTFTYNSSRTTNLYLDGVRVGGRNDLTSTNIHSTSVGFVLGIYTGNAYDFPGTIGPVHVYNRELSASDVLHNFNALRGRFGV